MHALFLAPPLRGHLDPLRAVAQTLVARGHRATLIARLDARSMWQAPGLDFAPVGETQMPAGTLPATVAALARRGPLGLPTMLRELARGSAMLCECAPPMMRALAADVLVADQAEAAGGLLGAHLELPMLTAACALPLDRDRDVPPPWRDWEPDPSPLGRRRNAVRRRIADALMLPLERAMATQARRLGLAPAPTHAWWSRSATVTQVVPGIDFPRSGGPPGFACVGPWRSAAPAALDAELSERLDRGTGRVAFCSLGTPQAARAGLFGDITGACADLGLTSVVAHAGALSHSTVRALPGSPVARPFIDQRAVLPHCAVAIVHGGLNTVLDALAAGVPMVVLPMGFEQPGIAARVRWHRVGAIVDPSRWRLRERLRWAIGTVLAGTYAARAAGVARALAGAGGVEAMADRVEATARGPAHRAPGAVRHR